MKWLVLYKRHRGKTERLIELPSMQKLMQWIEKNAAGCECVRILRVVEE